MIAVFVLPPGWGTVLLVAVTVREMTGRGAMIGMSVTAMTTCRPEGRFRFQGWQARCSMGALPGETLVVAGVDRITLIMGRAPYVGAR